LATWLILERWAVLSGTFLIAFELVYNHHASPNCGSRSLGFLAPLLGSRLIAMKGRLGKFNQLRLAATLEM
jgi:hypothetical protein